MMKERDMQNKIDFNLIANRRSSESEKWNTYPADTIPMWVADADYAVPIEVIEALKERLNHPVLGYGKDSDKLRTLIVSRLKRLYQWDIQPEWICFTPGVVSSLNICRAIMGDIGSNAITALPVYPHLQNPTPILQRGMNFFNMHNVDGRYTPDFAELEKNIDAQTKLLMLCNPHNPVGTVYTNEELQQFAAIAEKHDLLICSDDIHADFTLYEDKPYRPIATLSPAISQRSITLMAASKTFNIAGLNCSYAIIESAAIRRQFTTQLKGLVGSVNILGFIASEAAYEHGDKWLAAQIEHLRDNAEYCYQRIHAMPLLSMNAMEATYLAWIDATACNIKLKEKGYKNAYEYLLTYQLAVSDGAAFGQADFIRLNLATSRTILEKALNQLQQAIEAL